MGLDRVRSRLTIDADELATVIRVLADPDSGAEVPSEWVDAGLFVDGRLDESVAEMISMVVAPARTISIQRLGGAQTAPLTVGLGAKANAVIIEPLGDDRIEVTATTERLLPAMLLQAVHLDLGPNEAVDERKPVTRPLACYDTHRLDADIDDLELSGAAFPDEVGHPAFVWRAGAAWRGQEVDTTVTVLDGGESGLWFVDHDSDGGSGDALRFQPCTPRGAAIRLGDVVTGRAALRESA